MKSWSLVVALAAVAPIATLVQATTGTASLYNISDPTYGTCRLKGITTSSDNFKYYASVSSKDETLNSACARCITITRDDDSSISTTAYVLDVCDGCASGTVQLSADTMSALNIDSTGASVSVSYEFDSCPTSMVSGNIKACLMEGASATYVPLQFYNSQKVIAGATINSVTATSTSSSFLYSANSGSSSSTWYKNVEFSVTADNGESLNGGVAGGVAALLIIVGSVILVRRRRAASKDLDDPENDVENQYLSPTSKSKAAPVATGTSTIQSDHDHNDHQPPASPTVDYAESFSPAASSKVLSSHMSESTASTPVRATTAAAAVPAAVVAASMTVDSPASSVPSNHSSIAMSNSSSASPEPVYSYVEPTYAFSSNAITSPPRSLSSTKAAPTLSAPVVPRQVSGTGFQQFEDTEERSSFDVDNMRESEARATTSEEGSRRFGSQAYAPYSAADPYANSVTSPQSNIRATSLRRPSFKPSRMSSRESGRVSNADSYASTAPRQGNSSMISNNTALQASASDVAANTVHSYRGRPSMSADTDASLQDSYVAPVDLSASQRSIGSMRESGGYSRESLNILGYPYSKKSGRHHNTTG
ncbi:hypothetical protein BBO99_00006284 [Phytophthora kernoviae]|uniref:Expansin-like EG45 domain-containing protein n=1 Tax=Phytophthora kernoviae TaxID=325452 RepID=A0A3R7J8I2_9STRA|nr:hypothetical protein JM16_002361 [Phytophthora kernoviae]RLN20459.1 hypothetical protein BBI17_006409 [Phytophthora kernoviae]RLN78012.1 hypothetical protein BBO99_00006284 [Phytophthora kernoviae]